MNDPYDTGKPKYLTAMDIYEALQTLVNAAEEMGIMGEIFEDVSWEGSDYYYIDKAGDLLDKFNGSCDYGNEMWRLDLALTQLDDSEIHDTVYEALINSDLAKRIGFKKLFIDTMLRGDKRHYDEIAEAFTGELGELNRFDNWGMIQAYNCVLEERNEYCGVTPYPNLAHAVYAKVRGLNLQKECVLLAECRSLLTAYDDFVYGIRMNHGLYEGLEQRFATKMAALQEAYEAKVAQMRALAESQGVKLHGVDETLMLGDGNNHD